MKKPKPKTKYIYAANGLRPMEDLILQGENPRFVQSGGGNNPQGMRGHNVFTGLGSAPAVHELWNKQQASKQGFTADEMGKINADIRRRQAEAMKVGAGSTEVLPGMFKSTDAKGRVTYGDAPEKIVAAPAAAPKLMPQHALRQYPPGEDQVSRAAARQTAEQFGNVQSGVSSSGNPSFANVQGGGSSSTDLPGAPELPTGMAEIAEPAVPTGDMSPAPPQFGNVQGGGSVAYAPQRGVRDVLTDYAQARAGGAPATPQFAAYEENSPLPAGGGGAPPPAQHVPPPMPAPRRPQQQPSAEAMMAGMSSKPLYQPPADVPTGLPPVQGLADADQAMSDQMRGGRAPVAMPDAPMAPGPGLMDSIQQMFQPKRPVRTSTPAIRGATGLRMPDRADQADAIMAGPAATPLPPPVAAPAAAAPLPPPAPAAPAAPQEKFTMPPVGQGGVRNMVHQLGGLMGLRSGAARGYANGGDTSYPDQVSRTMERMPLAPVAAAPTQQPVAEPPSLRAPVRANLNPFSSQPTVPLPGAGGGGMTRKIRMAVGGGIEGFQEAGIGEDEGQRTARQLANMTAIANHGQPQAPTAAAPTPASVAAPAAGPSALGQMPEANPRAINGPRGMPIGNAISDLGAGKAMPFGSSMRNRPGISLGGTSLATNPNATFTPSLRADSMGNTPTFTPKNPQTPSGQDLFFAAGADLDEDPTAGVTGEVQGKGTPTSDEVKAIIESPAGKVQEARLSNKEYVLSKAARDEIEKLLGGPGALDAFVTQANGGKPPTKVVATKDGGLRQQPKMVKAVDGLDQRTPWKFVADDDIAEEVKRMKTAKESPLNGSFKDTAAENIRRQREVDRGIAATNAREAARGQPEPGVKVNVHPDDAKVFAQQKATADAAAAGQTRTASMADSGVRSASQTGAAAAPSSFGGRFAEAASQAVGDSGLGKAVKSAAKLPLWAADKGLRFAGNLARPAVAALDLGDVADVYTDPRHTGWDTAAEVGKEIAGKGVRWAGAGLGGLAGAAAGGPAAPVTGLAGAAAGYTGADWAMKQAGLELPSETSKGAVKKAISAFTGNVDPTSTVPVGPNGRPAPLAQSAVAAPASAPVTPPPEKPKEFGFRNMNGGFVGSAPETPQETARLAMANARVKDELDRWERISRPDIAAAKDLKRIEAGGRSAAAQAAAIADLDKNKRADAERNRDDAQKQLKDMFVVQNVDKETGKVSETHDTAAMRAFEDRMARLGVNFVDQPKDIRSLIMEHYGTRAAVNEGFNARAESMGGKTTKGLRRMLPGGKIGLGDVFDPTISIPDVAMAYTPFIDPNTNYKVFDPDTKQFVSQRHVVKGKGGGTDMDAYRDIYGKDSTSDQALQEKIKELIKAKDRKENKS